jgi:molecular chaperone GrpE
MTEIKVTVAGSPESEPSTSASAPAGGSTAPASGEQASAAGGHTRPSTPNGDSAPADGSGVPSTGATASDPGGQDPTTAHEDGAREIESDLDELVRKAAERDEYLALAQRTQADFENYRKRVAREAAAAQERGVCALTKELLPALDNLDRALEAAAEEDPLLEGVRLVRQELSAALARTGIESFTPLGETFDPTLHEAVATAPQPEGGARGGTVVEVYQAGYRLGESVIRPARVVVAA